MPGTIGRTIGRESVRTIGLLSVMPGTIGQQAAAMPTVGASSATAFTSVSLPGWGRA